MTPCSSTSTRLAFVSLVALAALTACGDSTSPAKVASVQVTAPVTTLERTQTSQFTARTLDASNAELTGQPVVWSSSNTDVATVDANSGLVTAVGRGTTNIRATSGTLFDEEPLAVIIKYNSIAVGTFATCDIGSIGIAHCWGSNNGQVGDNTTTDRLTPVNVSGATRFTQLAMEELHTCGLSTAGAVYCWGSNSSGQLGNSNPSNANVPVAVSGGLTFKSVTVGGAFTCAVTTANAGYCWGYNSFGNLGRGNENDTNAPAAVVGGLTFASIDAGGDFACGVTTTGQGYCWGSDTYGQLGNGGTISGQTDDLSTAPVQVAGGLTWSQISAGMYFACGVTTAGAGYCWGLGNYQLGNGDDQSSSSPVPVSGGLTFRSIDTGYGYACGVTTANEAWCWGANDYGQLGAESPVDLTRVPVRGGGARTFSEVAVGSSGGGATACGISVDRLSVHCWGRNDYGQLGNGGTSFDRNFIPAPVTGQQP
jgi:alpha-tubulin suppressor-like RCC1 family protein